MERLTKGNATMALAKHGDFWLEPYELAIERNNTSTIAQLIRRLAAYEDTGLEPDEITDFLPTLKEWRQNMGALRHVHELVTAEADGRLLVLPCKIGDTVYLPHKNDWGDVLIFEVVEIGVDRDGPFFVIDDEEHDHIPMSDIGADVFLSREEAEEALAKERDV